ncbi:cortical protein marker for cell polarity-domain-containing protein [Lipomyces japonicus]|uniref:cortical protein marker for cell polarity-domain-containing protein n=1 Tax=Lipomyces japonicus TaxID=56871 RepID=UPI0034CF1352
MRLNYVLRLALTASITAIDLIYGFDIQSVSLPQISLEELGQVGFAGDFRGISISQYVDQEKNIGSVSLSKPDSIIVNLPTNVFIDWEQSDGVVNAMCALNESIFVAGNFTTIGDSTLSSVAEINIFTGDIASVGDGINGTVTSAYCDLDANLVYFGGAFEHSVAIWNASNSVWNSIPFGGLNGGHVNAITKRKGNIIFGGIFNNLGNSTSANSTVSSSNVPEQVINIKTAHISATGSTTNSSNSNPQSIVCSSNSSATDSTWLLEDDSDGTWSASFQYEFTPTKLRLRNADVDNRGTKLFRFIAYPNDGIMNFTYTDPQTGNKKYCDAWCPLANITEADIQEFEFVNVIGMVGFSIEILDHYGAGAGLSSIELVQEQLVTFAIEKFNEPTSCGAETSLVASSAIKGSWNQTIASGITYLTTTNVSIADENTTYVDFYPDIAVSGNYTVSLFTPGCVSDNTCSDRGQVNVTIYPTADGDHDSVSLFQTNDYYKYDVIYEGYVEAGEGSFRPYVRLAPLESQNSANVIVAERLLFTLTSTSVRLNGLFEYDPANYTSNSSFSNSIVDTPVISAANSLLNSAEITSLLVANDSILIVGGNFSNENLVNNFFIINNNDTVSVADGGLNGRVDSMILSQDSSSVILGGRFDAIASNRSSSVNGLGYVASYALSTSQWSGLGTGVNGPVENIVRLSLNSTTKSYSSLALSGNFTDIVNDDNNTISVDGLAIWFESENRWAEDSDFELPYLTGSLSSSILTESGTYVLSGNVQAQSIEVSGSALLSDALQLSSLPYQFLSNVTGQSRLEDDSARSQVFTGSFYLNSTGTYSVIGGHFSIEADNGQTFNNLVILDDSAPIAGFQQEFNNTGTYVFTTLNHKNTTLLVGGVFEGSIGSSDVNGLVIWDLQTQTFASAQPASLTGGDNVLVSSIKSRPNTNEIVVAGSFNRAGQLTCRNLCVYNLDSGNWTALSRGISGDVSSIHFIDSDRMIVTGNMSTGDSVKCYFAQYDFASSSWSTLGQQSSVLPGPVHSFVSLSNSPSDAIITGNYADNDTTYLWAYQSDSWLSLDSALLPGSEISDLEILQLDGTTTTTTTTTTKSKRDNLSNLSSDTILLVLGRLEIDNIGNVSAALFDGDSWTPFVYSTRQDGSPGKINSLFVQATKSLELRYAEQSSHNLAKGFVVLISLAISLAIMFAIISIAILIAFYRRRRDAGYAPLSGWLPIEGSSSISEAIPPAMLFSQVGNEKI